MENLECIKDGPNISSNAIILVACVRNETLRLPDFLAHHRKLGVSCFFIIDNGSNDGTTEFLRAQDDVQLYYTTEPYSQSGCGIDWLNAVIAEVAIGHWTLVLDADELFVFPGYENTTLAEFLDWAARDGADAIAAPMLDMYPQGAIGGIGYQPGASLLETCPWFDSTGYSYHQINPDLEVIHRGGPRKRLFWDGYDRDYPSPVLFKIPLIKWQQSFALTASTHELKCAKLAEATGLLLHFKFLQDFKENAEAETQRAEHFMGARQYVAYNAILTENTCLTAFNENSKRFTDTRQLAELNLMSVPANYPFLRAVNSCTSGRETQEGVTIQGTWKDFFVVDQSAQDLGGNLRHGDGKTVTPALWQALIDRFAPHSMLDVGAGEAHAAAFFARRGVIAHGFDGLHKNIERAVHPIALHDLKSGPYTYPCDLVYCAEVVEHIAEQYLDHLMVTLTNAPVVVMTHALPGQRGHHHVNLQPPEYWVEKFSTYGYRPTIEIDFLRGIAHNERADSFFAQSGLVFLKAEQNER
ncbi:MAG: glycosyltransferase family 2 protein [Pseudomonadota bacterium]